MARPVRLGVPTLALLAALVAGCTCDGEEALRVSSDTSYVRCHAAAAPEDRSWEVGSLSLRREGRALRIEGAPDPLRLAVFAGPGDEALPVSAVRAAHPHLVAVLGDLGEPVASLRALAELGVPVLVVAGGEDRYGPLAEALDDLDGDAADLIVDASVLRSVRVGRLELVPVAGAPDGRYAVDDDACGVGEGDLDGWELGVAEQGVHRILLSWAGPRGAGPGSATRGLAGVEAGSALVSQVAERAGATGALFAWPRTALGTAEGSGSWALRLAVAPVAGASVLRFDGRRVAAGPTLLTVGSGGLRVAGARLDSPRRTD